jgi:hypothetical protein
VGQPALGVPPPEGGVGRELAAWLGRAGPAPVLVLGGLGGLAVTWVVWQLRFPLVGGDGLIYHLPIASAWVQNGRPGSIVNVLDGLSVANYPVTNEVLVSWGLAVSRSWVVSSIWSVVLLVVLAGASWTALRTLGVALRERILAVAALCVMPLIVAQLCGPDTDIAALAWLAVTAALAVGAVERPSLIFPAIVGAGLCFGTKTTPAILLLGLAVMARRPLGGAARDHRLWLVLSLLAAVVVGGVWSIRDLIVHGSPFWPLEASPWGTPVQASLVSLEPSFLSDPRALIANHGSAYLQTMAGALVLIGGGLGAAGLRRSRAALTVGGLAGLALLAWAVSPYTGIESGDYAAGATRYLLPAIAACTLALVVSARGAGRSLRAGIDAVLGVSIAWSILETAQLGGQFVPGPGTLVAGLAVGGGAAEVARRLLVRDRPDSSAAATPTPQDRPAARGKPGDTGSLAGIVAAGTLAVVAALGLAVASDGYVARHARTGEIDGPVLEAGLPGLGRGTRPIAIGPATVVMLRGDHLDHPLSVIGGNATCTSLRALLGRATVVLQGEPVTPIYTRLTACLGGLRPEFADEYVDVYG